MKSTEEIVKFRVCRISRTTCIHVLHIPDLPLAYFSTLQVDSTKSTLTNFVLITLLIILTDGLKKLAEVWKC